MKLTTRTCLCLTALLLSASVTTQGDWTHSDRHIAPVERYAKETREISRPLFMAPLALYYLNLTAANGGTTSPAAGVIPEASGDITQVSATPYPHYQFDHWQLDDLVQASNPITVVMNTNHTLRGFFSPLLNRPPILSVPGPQTVSEGSALTFWVNATDPDVSSETIKLSASGLPAGSTFDPAAGTFSTGNPAAGVFSWIPLEGQGPANYLITFTATDDAVPPLSDMGTVNVHVNEANLPPHLSVPASQTMNTQTTLNFTVRASDSDIPNQTLTLSAISLPPGASFNPSTGVFTWTPTLVQAAGNYTVTFQVSDGSLTDTKSVLITVNSVNLPPILSVPTSQTIDPGTLLEFTIIATDPDLPHENIILSANGLPPGATFDQVTGTFSWRPSLRDGPGVYNIAFSADDGRGAVATHRVTVTVNKPVLAVTSLSGISELGPLWYLAIGLLVLDILVLLVLRRRRSAKDIAIKKNRD